MSIFFWLSSFVVLLCGLGFSAIVLWVGKKISFLIPALHDPVYVPSHPVAVQTIFDFIEKMPKKTRIADLGSGDGRIVIGLAQRGFLADGYEIDPLLSWQSRQQVRKLYLHKKVRIFNKSFWKQNFSLYDVVILYATQGIMEKMEAKLWHELRPGAIVISHHFQFPRWPAKDEKNDVFVYEKR
jgi:hypothetical protein